MLRITILVLAVGALGFGCKKDEQAPPRASTPAPPPAPRPVAPPGETLEGVELPSKMALSHILFSYKGAFRAGPEVTRSKEEARKAAHEALAKLKAGARFEELASTQNDDPMARSRKGLMGTFPQHILRRLAPPLVRVAAKLPVGAISDVVETRFGFEILRREKIEEVRASHILYMYKGSKMAPPSTTRTKTEARQAATEALARLKAGASFAEIASKESDCPSKAKGGDLGPFGRGVMAKAFEEAAFALKVGELSSVVETPFGFHVIKRTE
jgi:NIMA-interacting peptidyl-prolyl cis-trans isomerase 1